MTQRRINVSVLGLGRMGSAMARRLADEGFAITAWSRRPVPLDDVTSASGAAEAVRDADVVVLALYDGPACRDVLQQCLGDTRPHCTVLNTSTVAAGEASALRTMLRDRSRRYVHGPVLGSVSAARSGSLTVLTGDGDHPPEIAAVLHALGDVVPCGDAATAATLKLVANGVLADGVLALGHALARARRLDIDRDLMLDVLQRTSLGGLTSAKRPWLEGGDRTADFTAGALGKDVRLLSGIDPVSACLRQALETSDTPEDADIGVLSARLGAGRRHILDASSRLCAEPNTCTDDGLLTPLISYARGHATGDAAHFRDAFRPTAHIEGIRDGGFVSWDLDAYCANFAGRPASDESSRTRTITDLRCSGSVAHATMLLQHATDTFTDLFVLIREHGTWCIANKVYHRATAE